MQPNKNIKELIDIGTQYNFQTKLTGDVKNSLQKAFQKSKEIHMIQFKKPTPEPKPDSFIVRDITLDLFIKYCSKSTGNVGLKELEVHTIKDYQRIKRMCDILFMDEGQYPLYDNTLVVDKGFTMEKGIVKDFDNKCTLNFIVPEDLKENVTLLYYNRGVPVVTIMPKDSIDLFIHTLKVTHNDVKVRIHTDSYVR